MMIKLGGGEVDLLTRFSLFSLGIGVDCVTFVAATHVMITDSPVGPLGGPVVQKVPGH